MNVSIVRVTRRNSTQVFATLRPLNRIFAQKAFAMGKTIDVFSGANMFRFQHRAKWHYVKNVIPELNTHTSSLLADNKILTSLILADAGFPVPCFMGLTKKEFLANPSFKLRDIPFPVVIKPALGTCKGYGVITNIRNTNELHSLLRHHFRRYPSVIIEQFYDQVKHYRLLVLDHKVLSVIERIPPFVVGDGNKTIRQLIQEKNEKRKKEIRIELGLIRRDAELQQTLRGQNISLSTRLRKNQRVVVRNVCNLGSGGESREVTHLVCPENRRRAIHVVRALSLRYAGVDFMCPDIAKPLTKRNGAINEVNEHPSIDIHYFPQYGTPRDVAMPVLRAIFASY